MANYFAFKIMSIVYSLLIGTIFAFTDHIYNIKDFRSNPMGIAQREDLFEVNLGIPNNTRVLAYADFNSDK